MPHPSRPLPRPPVILTGLEIAREVASGRITISPFSREQLNPNSYNYRLADHLRVSRSPVLDPYTPADWDEVRLTDAGYVLEPNRLYLGSTIETIGSAHYVPSLIGRSSLGRLGLFLECSADLGNLGAIHAWTLELNVAQPLRIYSRMPIGQVTFWVPKGDVVPYRGRYSRRSDPMPAELLSTPARETGGAQ